MKTLGFILLLGLTSVIYSAEKVKIAQILESNLFLLQDGRKITLAGLEMPSVNTKRPELQELVKKISKFESVNLLNQLLEMETDQPAENDSSVLAVHLFKTYPLSRVNINARMLELGLANYSQVEISEYHLQYLSASSKALENQSGLYREPGPAVRNYSVLYFSADVRNSSFLDFSTQPKPGDAYMFLFTYRFLEENLSGFEFEIGQLYYKQKYYDYYYGESRNEQTIYLGLKTNLLGKYFGSSLKLLFLSNKKVDYYSTRFLLPSFDFYVGWIGNAYFSFKIIDGNLLGLYQSAFNYHFSHVFNKIWVGRSWIDDDAWLGAGAEWELFPGWIITGQLNFKVDSANKMGRFGFGFVLN